MISDIDAENIKRQLEDFEKAVKDAKDSEDTKSYPEEKKSYPIPSWAKNVGSLTKRELVASMALQGLLSNPSVLELISGSNGLPSPAISADTAIACADALLQKCRNED